MALALKVTHQLGWYKPQEGFFTNVGLSEEFPTFGM